ncbi:hypothetical protein BJY01DRAFT_242463 [Aspergillus pseudoustus]|uniref:EthD domain-containing protein n=1 Tax=Aspergillus pseudoustus TaxID=1810923 RepID=A0ABR4KXQ0_9EURO
MAEREQALMRLCVCLSSVWCILLVSFENQASGNVTGISEFRKDFGYYFEGDWPETAGRAYAELDEMFMEKVPARKFKEYKTNAEAMDVAAIDGTN